MKKLNKFLAVAFSVILCALTATGCTTMTDQIDVNDNTNTSSSSHEEGTPSSAHTHVYGEWQTKNGKTVRICSCGDVQEMTEVTPIQGAVTLTANLIKPLNLSLLKKVSMYNAGTIDPINNYKRDLGLIEALNAESLRIDLSIGKGDGGRNYTGYEWLVTGSGDNYNNYKYNFNQLDGIVEQLQNKDVLPYMSWCYVPKPLQGNNDWRNLNQNLSNWKEAWKNIYYNYAKHYVDEGLKIGYHEIYNEPDLSLGEGGTFLLSEDFNAGRYNDMYVYGSKGILEADPDATIGGPAFAGAWSATNTGFINAVKNAKAPMDFFSFHSYMDGSEWPDELNYTDDIIAKDNYFLTTAIHINEFSWLNANSGGRMNANCEFNKYTSAYKTIEAIMELVGRTDVQWAHWAQFMESTCGEDPYGLIFKDGHVKAAYNAIKMFNDMPVWRYDISKSANDNAVKAVFSANNDKMGFLVWNTSSSEKSVNLSVANSYFDGAVRRVYRIDSRHGSYYENHSNEHLVAEEVGAVNIDAPYVWSGKIPAYGVVYVSLNDSGEDDFTAWANRRTLFANDVKTSYYYADRQNLDRVRAGTSSYAHFDRNSWTMYLSQGAYNDAHANASVIVTDLPSKFRLNFNTEGNLRKVNVNSALAFRIDYFDEHSGKYVKSVLFHNGIYNKNRTAAFAPWGTGRAPDEVVEFSGYAYDVDVMKYAPSGWSTAQKAQISYIMQNTGANTRAAIVLE